jgi:hypothetical protein
MISGRATLDGEPITARWIGAVVIDEGLVTPCQVDLPPIDNGQFEIPVYTRQAAAGCGERGANVVLWTNDDATTYYATAPVPWPDAPTATADITFSTANPRGAAPQTSEFEGAVLDRDGRRVPAGTIVEAYIGGARCGVASVRSGIFDGYTMSVVGPDSNPACNALETITFKVGGRPVLDTRTHLTDRVDPLDLTLA